MAEGAAGGAGTRTSPPFVSRGTHGHSAPERAAALHKGAELNVNEDCAMGLCAEGLTLLHLNLVV